MRRDNQAFEATETRPDLEEAQAVEHGGDCGRCVRSQEHAEESRSSTEIPPPQMVAGILQQAGVENPRDHRPPSEPARHFER